MDDGSAQKLLELEVKLDSILVSVEKTRKYIQVTMWVTIVFIVVPLFASIFIIPFFLNSYLGSINAADSPSAGSVQSQLDLLNSLLQ